MQGRVKVGTKKDLFLVKVYQFYRGSFTAYPERILDFWNWAYHGSYHMVLDCSIITNDSFPLTSQGQLTLQGTFGV